MFQVYIHMHAYIKIIYIYTYIQNMYINKIHIQNMYINKIHMHLHIHSSAKLCAGTTVSFTWTSVHGTVDQVGDSRAEAEHGGEAPCQMTGARPTRPKGWATSTLRGF